MKRCLIRIVLCSLTLGGLPALTNCSVKPVQADLAVSHPAHFEGAEPVYTPPPNPFAETAAPPIPPLSPPSPGHQPPLGPPASRNGAPLDPASPPADQNHIHGGAHQQEHSP